MPLTIEKWERRDSADRNSLGLAALGYCRANKSADGIHSSKFYWGNADTLVIITEADPGAYGPGSGGEPNAEAAKASFALSDLARSTSIETLVDARMGKQTYDLSQ